ncbi:MAG: gamma-glutamyl-gamma-aminobutyrate hydrolase family protein [Proteobacteria bacterium]|nr:gamma-glutamyl-gamma-aminobutyrate hydrolase family protein [Pseudomonadota bacterium]
MSKQPLIAIIPDYDKGDKTKYSAYPHYCIRSNYTDMISDAGALSIIVPYDHKQIDAYLDLVDGLMIVGGDFDISPERYGESDIHPKTKINKVRESFEYEFTEKALQKGDMPILGICNGMQLINILHQGTIIQHIPDHESFMNHEQRSNPDISGNDQPYHQVNIEKGSKLFDILQDEVINTNSTHHQGVGEVGEQIAICAKASDGMIEAIEHKNHQFCVAVQWHPEYSINAADKRLFKSFVDACSNYKKQHGR